MILLDTDIIIDFLRNYQPAIDWLKSQESNSLSLPGFVKMEIIQGCRNKEELHIILSFLSNYEIVWPHETTLENATNVFSRYFLSHGIDIVFERRSKRPPKDYINAMISFTNSLIYNYVLSEIYKTHLDPRIGFLHTSNFRRFSLNLDVAEIFKPIIGDRTIFSAINKGIITAKDFDDQLNGMIFTDAGKQKFISHLEERLKATIKHHKLKREVSYRRLMRLELYKMEKHFIGDEEYQPFVMDW